MTYPCKALVHHLKWHAMIFEIYKTHIAKCIIYSFRDLLFVFFRTACSFGEIDNWYVRHVVAVSSEFCRVQEAAKREGKSAERL
jgi:hypothetical protein